MPRFRTGTKVGLNVYDGDRPIFQAHSEHDAERLTELLNVGERVETVTLAHLTELFDASERWWGEEDFLERLLRATWRLFTSPDAPLSAPETSSEPPAATGQPADATEAVWVRSECGYEQKAWLHEGLAPPAIGQFGWCPHEERTHRAVAVEIERDT